MPTIYEIYHGGDIAKRAFTSKKQAIKAARAEIDAGATDEPVEIEKIETPPLTVALLLDLINSSGGCYVQSRETVQTVTRGHRKAAPPAAPDVREGVE